MEINWRIGAGSAALAFTVSIIFGLFGGVEFGVLLLRAFLGSLLFAVLGSGGYFLMRRFLPELFEETTANRSGSGEGVDIVIQDDGSEGSADSEAAEKAEHLQRDYGYSEDGAEEDAAAEYDSLVEEIEEVSDTADSTPVVAASKRENEVRDETYAASENVDALPDLGALETSFESPVREQEGGSDSGPPSGRGVEGESLGGGQDPALLAKVVQTILKKGNQG